MYFKVDNLVIRVDKVVVNFDQQGKIKTIFEPGSVGERIQSEISIGNVINRISREIDITKETILKIFSQVDNLDILFKNPEEYERSVVVIIKSILNDLLINEGLQYTPVDDVWEIELFEDFKSYQTKTIKSEKSIYNRVVFDSTGEKEFAKNLEESRSVTLFAKLSASFAIDTPLGSYNPDWAIVMRVGDENKLYLMRETKFAGKDMNKDKVLKNLRQSGKQKIVCGQKHFKAINVDFTVAVKKDLSDLIK